jgi:hypothetical protein
MCSIKMSFELVGGGSVLQKCVNPVCGAQFRYLHEGKLFEVETQYLGSVSGDGQGYAGRGMGQVERCWLCDECAANHMLRFDHRFGIVVSSSQMDSEAETTTAIPEFASNGGVGIARVLIRRFELMFDGLNRRMSPSERVSRRSAAA